MNPLDRFRLDDKVVLVTGASSGLGVGFAHALAAAGATLVLAARREEQLQAVAEDVRAHGTTVLTVRTDVSALEDCEAAAAEAAGNGEAKVTKSSGFTATAPRAKPKPPARGKASTAKPRAKPAAKPKSKPPAAKPKAAKPKVKPKHTATAKHRAESARKKKR